VNLLGDNIDYKEKHQPTNSVALVHEQTIPTDTLIDASKEVGLEISVEKTKYMLLSRHQNVGQNRDIKITNRLFENVSEFKYLGMTVANQNLIQEEIKRRLNSGNAHYHSVQNVLSPAVGKLKN
jgi:hypothetical protein